jgi:hypothetical protein
MTSGLDNPGFRLCMALDQIPFPVATPFSP